jgi:hypothetical protein
MPGDDAPLLAEIRAHACCAQSRAVLAVNAELIRPRWTIGGLIHRWQREGW